MKKTRTLIAFGLFSALTWATVAHADFNVPGSAAIWWAGNKDCYAISNSKVSVRASGTCPVDSFFITDMPFHIQTTGSKTASLFRSGNPAANNTCCKACAITGTTGSTSCGGTSCVAVLGSTNQTLQSTVTVPSGGSLFMSCWLNVRNATSPETFNQYKVSPH